MSAAKAYEASDGKTYRIDIRGNRYVISLDGAPIHSAQCPASANPNTLPEDEAAWLFATSEVEARIHSAKT